MGAPNEKLVKVAIDKLGNTIKNLQSQVDQLEKTYTTVKKKPADASKYVNPLLRAIDSVQRPLNDTAKAGADLVSLITGQ